MEFRYFQWIKHESSFIEYSKWGFSIGNHLLGLVTHDSSFNFAITTHLELLEKE
jgi:hypothetical protein